MSPTDATLRVALTGLLVAGCGAGSRGHDTVAPATLIAAGASGDLLAGPGDPDILSDIVDRLGVETCAVPPRVALRTAVADPVTEREVARLDRLSRWLCSAGIHRVDAQWAADGAVLLEPEGSGRLEAPGALFVLDGFEDFSVSGTVSSAPVSACEGLSDGPPDLTVYVVADLAVHVRAVGDGVFVRVRGPDGRETCAEPPPDDVGIPTPDAEAAPAQALLSGEPGPHRVWIGGTVAGASWQLVADASPAAGSHYRTWRFGDPITAPVQVGPYSVAAPTTDDQWCSGFIGTAPTMRVHVPSEGWGGVSVASGGADPVLVLRGPNGELFCNDDYDGYDPRVDGWFAAGPWDVYVGSFGAGDVFDATLRLE